MHQLKMQNNLKSNSKIRNLNKATAGGQLGSAKLADGWYDISDIMCHLAAASS